MNLIERPRRLRRTATIRALVRETRLSPDDFVYPAVCLRRRRRSPRNRLNARRIQSFHR